MNVSGEPIVCDNCDGEGTVEIMEDRGRLNSAGYPIPDYRDEECPECKGTGETACSYHRDRPAVEEVEGDFLCVACYASYLADLDEE